MPPVIHQVGDASSAGVSSRLAVLDRRRAGPRAALHCTRPRSWKGHQGAERAPLPNPHRWPLTDAALEAFDGWKIEPAGPDTALIGDMDQAALHGVLNRIYCLDLHLIEVCRLRPTPANGGP